MTDRVINIYWKYAQYVIRHKWFVLRECFKAGIIWRGLLHDNSKFLPDEFMPYAIYFNAEKTAQILAKFNVAWLLHQKRNPHHWQYWILQNDDGNQYVLDMPIVYINEMIADWRGAGKAQGYGNNTIEWYKKNRRKIILSDTTRHIVEFKLKEEENNNG